METGFAVGLSRVRAVSCAHPGLGAGRERLLATENSENTEDFYGEASG
jgi:hypothetical protein